MSEEEKSNQETKADSSAKKKEEKEPPIEDKPLPEFIKEHYEPTLKEALTQQGIEDLELEFKTDKFPLPGGEECPQLVGEWDGGKRRFNVYFLDEDISGKKAFSYSATDAPPSTIESFMIDERKVNLDLLVMYTVQRLNGQKWIDRN
ncbi:DUF2996 domain-containing protein [Dactylococcopsis salina]|uniref:DUF2996 domain-containing protein n=1 Tax=Dactylococcopsis salina (strain PCC 8305) TaxID=13035 RepID=K9YXL9_DACS8|nr:DUF2996 domain-containing protein [Dactylococcopsis salina]AFZ51664.1 Protein of unknown function (DUF2996) [Dactylococcopsis salina PCC 8305]